MDKKTVYLNVHQIKKLPNVTVSETTIRKRIEWVVHSCINEWEIANKITREITRPRNDYYGDADKSPRKSRMYEAQNPDKGGIRIYGNTMMQMITL